METIHPNRLNQRPFYYQPVFWWVLLIFCDINATTNANHIGFNKKLNQNRCCCCGGYWKKYQSDSGDWMTQIVYYYSHYNDDRFFHKSETNDVFWYFRLIFFQYFGLTATTFWLSPYLGIGNVSLLPTFYYQNFVFAKYILI